MVVGGGRNSKLVEREKVLVRGGLDLLKFSSLGERMRVRLSGRKEA